MKVTMNNNGWVVVHSENDEEAEQLRVYVRDQTQHGINVKQDWSEQHAFNHNSFAVRWKIYGPVKVMS